MKESTAHKKSFSSHISEEEKNQLQEFIFEIEDLTSNGEHDKAITILNQKINERESMPIYYSLLGKIYEGKGKLSRSIDTYNAGLEKHPGDAYLLIGLGFIYYNQKDYQKAEPNLLHAWIEDPTNIRLLTALGNIYKNEKNFRKAIKYYEIASLLDPDNTFAIYGIANCYRGIGEFARELEFWLKFHGFEPNNKIAITRIGDCYYKLEEFEKAMEFYNKALEINYDFYALLGKAKVYQKMDEPAKAEDIYLGLNENDRSNIRFYNEFIKFLIDTRKITEARKLYNDAVEKFPNNKYITSLKNRL